MPDQDSSKDLPLRGKVEESHFAVLGNKELKDQFPFDPEWRNMNHGSFGSIPNAIVAKVRAHQTAAEGHPDRFIRYEYPKLLDASRAAVAGVVKAPTDTVVFVGNATIGVNTVLKNLEWNDDGKDVIVFFSTIYDACAKIADYLSDYTRGKVSTKQIQLDYPLEDDEILQRFRDGVKEIEATGKRARVCIFDVVSSCPGVLFPWIAMIAACKALGVISMVDGAQGIGMVPLDLPAADPDFFVSNCHKWLFVPRGCAVLYVPLRNQALLPTTLATSHGYVPRNPTVTRISPLPPSSQTHFVHNFGFVGTLDNAPYACAKDAVAWRRDVLGGEDRIMSYLWDLNKRGSKRVAEMLGTEVLDNGRGTMTNCAMANVALPVWSGARGAGARETDIVVPAEEREAAFQWILETMTAEYNTFTVLYMQRGRFWARISAQVYLDMDDYEFTGRTLKELCERVGRGEYRERKP